MTDGELDPTQAVPLPDATRVDLPAAAVGGGSGQPPTSTWQTTPPPPPPDRRPWILVGLLALIVVVLILILVLRGDDDSSTDATGTTTTSAVATSTTGSSSTSSSTTSSTVASTTSTSAAVVTIPPAQCASKGTGPAKPGLAADTVYDAWVRGDKACAKTLMTTAAANELFSRDGTDAHDEAQGCSEEELPDPHTDCAFTYEGGVTHYLMNFSDTDGWKVYDITQVAD